MALRTKRADGIDLTDPVEQVSLAKWFALSIFLLLLSTVWAIYEEVWGLRPWKDYQAKFKVAARAHYQRKLEEAQKELKELQASDEYQAAVDAAKDASEDFDKQRTERTALENERSAKLAELEKVRKDLGDIRGEYQALVYQWEQAKSAEAKADLKKGIDAREGTVLALVAKMTSLDAEVQSLGNRIFEFGKDKSAAEAKVAEFAARVRRFTGLRDGLDEFKIELRHINVPGMGAKVDRCISCHVGAMASDLEDIGTTIEKIPDLWKHAAKYESLFKTHPGDHLQRHPPGKFGCTSCHAGDGYSAATEWEAHGSHHYEVYPMFKAPKGAKEPFGHMAEAGCNKCHIQEMDLPGAPLLSYGKQLFSEMGCVACHKAKGVAPELDRLDEARKRLASAQKALEETRTGKAQLPKEEEKLDKWEEELDEAQDAAADGAENYQETAVETVFARKKQPLMAAKAAFAAKTESLRKGEVELAETVRVATNEVAELTRNVKLHGPNLMKVRDKLRPSFLKEWLLNPHDFNPETKMPRFWFLDGKDENHKKAYERQVEAVAAYLWQNADAPAPSYRGTPPKDEATLVRGQRLLESSGCLACHVGGEHDGKPIDTRQGIEGTHVKERMYGPSLVRTGEKARYDYLVRWLLDPKALAPQTRMPNMRLDRDQAEAIAAYLVTRQEDEVPASAFDEVPAYLEDKTLAKEGFEVIQRYGCYSCHNIKGTEGMGRIGVELSAHGSKNLHLFDFGLIEKKVAQAKHPGEHHPLLSRYDYISYKAQNPRSFEEGRYYTSPTADEHLRMPSFGLSDEEAHAVATFVVSLVEEPVPSDYVFAADYPRGALPAGRNLVVKHNCAACHVIEGKGGPLRQVVFKDLLKTKYEEDEEFRSGFKLALDLNAAPPDLWTIGSRVRSEWMFHFLKKPETIRPWALARMPQFELSDDEAIKLVEYFQALDRQAYPYASEVSRTLDPAQQAEVLKLMGELQCSKCHVIDGKPASEPQAPNLDLTKARVKRDWIATWVRNAPGILPYTAMPSFEKQIDERQAYLIADYLASLGDRRMANAPGIPAEGSRAGDE